MNWLNVIIDLLEKFLGGVALPFVLGIVLPLAVAWLRGQFGKHRVLRLVLKAAQAAVKAAEVDEFIDDKLAYASTHAENWLNDRGIKVDIDYLVHVIETEVSRQLNWDDVIRE